MKIMLYRFSRAYSLNMKHWFISWSESGKIRYQWEMLSLEEGRRRSLVEVLEGLEKGSKSWDGISKSRPRFNKNTNKTGCFICRKDSHWKHEYLQNWNNNGNKKTPTNLVKELEGGRVSWAVWSCCSYWTLRIILEQVYNLIWTKSVSKVELSKVELMTLRKCLVGGGNPLVSIFFQKKKILRQKYPVSVDTLAPMRNDQYLIILGQQSPFSGMYYTFLLFYSGFFFAVLDYITLRTM